VRKEERQMNTKTLSLKSLSGWDEFGTWRGFDLWNCVFGVNARALVLNVNFWNLGCQWMRWLGGGVFIAPNHFLAVGKGCWRLPHQKVTVHYPVHATSTRPLGCGGVDRWSALSSCCTRQSGDLWLLRSNFCRDTVHCVSRPLLRREPLLRWLTRQSGEL
jgi:hypothetical protein